MATTFVSQRTASLRYRSRSRFGWKAFAAAVLGAVVAGLVPAASVHGATRGFTEINGYQVLNLLGFTTTPINTNAEGAPTGDPPRINLDNTRFNLIFNEYIAFVQGHVNSSNFTQSVFGNGITFQVPGRISIGNIAGSLRTTGDDRRALTGPGSLADDPISPTGSELLFPLASDFATTNGFQATSFVGMTVDGAPLVLGRDTPQAAFPQFRQRRNELYSEYQAGPNNVILIEQTIRLRRSTVMFEWRIRNVDPAAAHSVALQYVVSLDQIRFFENPNRGRTTEPTEFLAGNIPETLTFTNARVDPTYYSRFRLRGFGATPPDRARVAAVNPYYHPPTYAQPDLNQYPDIIGTRVGPGAILDWNAAAIPPGGSRTIITYFGNGASTEDLSPDYVVGTEAEESLRYNTDANNQIPDAAKIAPTAQTGGAFLSPNPFTVYGSVYNQTPSDPENAVPLTNVQMSLSLPPGLRLGTNAATNQTDTQSKPVGTVGGDSEGRATWTVAPTGEAYGALTYQMAVSAPPLAGRTISRVINVPATPVRTFSNADWNLISFPFAFDPARTNNGDPSTVLNGITTQPDLPGGGLPIFRWVPDQLSQTGEGRYERVAQVGPGVAYFYRPTVNRTVYLNGAVPVPEQAPLPTGPQGANPTGQATPFSTTLARGWNMIGNPYVYNIPVAYIRVVPLENNPNLRSFTFSEAITAGFLRGALFFYTGQSGEDTSSYDFLSSLSDTLSPWVGYWLFANSRANLIYAAPTTVNTAVLGATPTGLTGTAPAQAATRGAVQSGRMLVKNPTLDNWKLQIVARNEDGRRDGATFLGVSPQAKDDDDISDLPKPPSAVQDYVYAALGRAGTTTRLAQDLKAPGGAKSWDFEVATDGSDAVTLSWPSAARLPKRLRLKLTDLETSRSIDMRSASSYRVTALSREVPRRFRITAETGTSSMLAISGLRAVSVGRAVAGAGGGDAPTGYRFDYQLNKAATVSGSIRTLSGKVVRTLSTPGGRAASVGANSFRWNGRGQNEEALPAGPYQVEITARDSDGTIATQRRAILLLR